MARKARQRISYVLPLTNSAKGHRLGVNGLAVDSENAVLYSGGRDGVICAWDLNLDLSSQPPTSGESKTVLRQQVQAHTHWINDIVLARNNELLVSASSDISVKAWRPGAEDGSAPSQALGSHSDYVKCLASPGAQADWVASGALDRKICLWDLSGAGKKLEIAVGEPGEEASSAKGSVYALAATGSILASGGPENIVRLWDARNGKRVTKFVGHTDNIRDVLIAQDGDTIMTASSDQTVKIWSMAAGRCMHTLTMHNNSVWSLYSDHPQLSVFYSSDRSGIVAKTHVRDWTEIDDGLSVSICQEHSGVGKVIKAGNYIWTATSSSSINRWCDVDTEQGVEVPETVKFNHRSSITTVKSRVASPPPISPSAPSTSPETPSRKQIPVHSILRLSNTSPFPYLRNKEADAATLYSAISGRKPSDAFLEPDSTTATPYHNLPDYSIEGQNGLIKHTLLNDRRRVLTLDSAGEVMMWDLVKCAPIRSFGKRHIEDILPDVNPVETVAHWCAVNTRTGTLACVLEENYCFDAEMYADEIEMDEKIEFREDQRVNLGKWVLRYLFSNLIDEEIRRDDIHRRDLVNEKKQSLQRSNAPGSIELPQSGPEAWKPENPRPPSVSTIKPTNGTSRPMATPGLSIGVATPGAQPPLPVTHSNSNPLSPTAEEGTQLEKVASAQSPARASTDKGGDYFSTQPQTHPPTTPGGGATGKVSTDGHEEAPPQSPVDGDKDTQGKEGKGTFGSKFRMTFGMKKLGKTQTSDKPAPVEEKSTEADSDSQSGKTDDRVVEDNFLGVIQKIRHGYEDQIRDGAQSLVTAINPSLPSETPVLKPPMTTTILIQEESRDSGGVADLFEGTVATLGQQADAIEKVAPTWLGDVLLRNSIPSKEIVKVSFILEPYDNILPPLATDGNNRLNANRMLRAKKILSYVAERIEPPVEEPDPNALRPDEYLDLYCNDQLVPIHMTLATMRAHVWRGGGDVVLHYKANGRKEIRVPPPPSSEQAPASSASSEMGASSEKDGSVH